MKRTFWRTDANLEAKADYTSDSADRYEVALEDEALLIGSMTDTIMGDGPLHMPAIDIDHPCRLVPSSTDGHFHLYIDVPMSWGKYKKLLFALADAGVVERGYADASANRGQSFLRKPGVTK